MKPIEAHIVNRPKPKLPDRMLDMQEFMYYCSDLSCWRADQAERYLSGIAEENVLTS